MSERVESFQEFWPYWSLRGEFKMLGLALTGRMADEVTRLYGSATPAADAPRLVSRGSTRDGRGW